MAGASAAVFMHSMTLLACLGTARLDAQDRVAPLALISSACDKSGSKSDSDSDGITDTCELALARTWAPRLLADPADCSWIDEDGERRLAGGYFFAVEPVAPAGGVVRIAYLPAYFRDCGWRGIQRLLRFGRTNAHAGDSELIVIDVVRGADAVKLLGISATTRNWNTINAILAHTKSRGEGHCLILCRSASTSVPPGKKWWAHRLRRSAAEA